MTGTVVFFNAPKGWGFIKNDAGGEDVFCHHSAIEMEGYRALDEGDRVQFDIEEGRKGLQAANVTKI